VGKTGGAIFDRGTSRRGGGSNANLQSRMFKSGEGSKSKMFVNDKRGTNQGKNRECRVEDLQKNREEQTWPDREDK